MPRRTGEIHRCCEGAPEHRSSGRVARGIGASVAARHGHAGYVTSLDCTDDEWLLVTGSYDGTLRFWDPRGSAPVLFSEEEVKSGLPYSLAFDPAGETLVWRPSPTTLQAFDLTTRTPRFTLPPFEVETQLWDSKYLGLILGVEYDTTGDALFAVHAYGGRLRRWNAITGKLEETLGEDLPQLWFAAFSNDRTRYAACALVADEWRIEIRNLATGLLEPGCSWPTETMSTNVCFTPDDRFLIHSRTNGTIFVRDLMTGEVAMQLELQLQPHDLACSPTDDLLAVTSYDPDDRSLWIFDLKTGARRRLEGNNKPFLVTFMPDGTRIVTGNRDDGTVSLWDVERGLTLNLSSLEGTIQQIAVSADGHKIAAVDSSGVHRVWNGSP